MKTYAVLIPIWNASIPKDWKLEMKAIAAEEFADISGTEILAGQGDLLRIEPTDEPHAAQIWLEGAVTHRYVREVSE
jgi:hypothetical protein